MYCKSPMVLAALIAVSSAVLAQAPSLGSAQSFAVLGGSTVTNAGATSITGDLGVSPGTAVTGFPPGIMTGTLHAGDAVALQAQNDLTTAYTALTGAACTVVMTGQDLGGLTLTPGVYCFAASAPLNGALTLDAQGDSNAVFIFQIGSTLLAAIGSSVQVINGAQEANVFWQVGSSATLAAGTAFSGNIIALASITLGVGANVSGRALARTGAVTMDTSIVSVPTSATCNTLATSVLRSGPNPVILTSVNLPQLGSTWRIDLDCSGHASTGKAWLFAYPQGNPGVSTYAGDLLVKLTSTRIFLVGAPHFGGSAPFSITVPPDLIFCGMQVFVQGACLGAPQTQLSNAIDSVLGF